MFGWLTRAAALGLATLWVLTAQAADEPGSPLERAALLLNSEPIRPVPLRRDLDPELLELGRQLFFDARLSGDGETHCGSCHQLPPIGEDQRLTDVSAVMGKYQRSVPLLYNVSEYYWFNWDGRFSSLEQLLNAAITDPDKMNTEWSQALTRLAPDYDARFRQLNERPMAKTDVVQALVTFLHSLNAPNARFDRYLRGDQNALTERERRGYRLFKDVGCATCHNGRSVGANFFEQFYVYRHEGGQEGEPRLQDLGRYYVTGEGEDNNLFRVPSLRNVALTAPYFHDGSSDTLDHAIEEMAEHQLGVELDRNEIDLLVDFLATLTGTHPGVEP
ncbi:cytochrome-c peroxidase [Motiliproteus sediminis]|uniref:cytochrome-c peroxidase n=1 Tax=Motiliproteus sediminis TaxID=1468178 RepID=UPI001AEFD20A